MQADKSILGVMSFPAVYNNDNNYIFFASKVRDFRLYSSVSHKIFQPRMEVFCFDSVLVCSSMWVAQTLFFHKYQQCTTVFA